MIKQPYTFYVERHDPQRNMARYYAMEIVPDLFGQPCLTRRWGRIGKRGQRKQHQFAKESEAVVLFLEIMQKKLRRGYRAPGVPKAVALLMQSPIADATEPYEQGFRRARAKSSHLNRDSAATTAKGARSR
jgi:predicted DNA-binding WGR domain protein